mgnify:FL=1
MTNRERYIQFCSNTPELPIFMQSWWLDAVCAGKQWDVLLYEHQDGEICAVMPYLLRQRAFMRYIIMPQMTQIGGVWVRKDIQEDNTMMQSICVSFQQQLEALDLSYYYQQYPLHSTVPMIMEQLGFKTKKRITYRIEDLSNLDKVIDAFSKNKKRQLQKALSLHATRDLGIEDFYRFHTQCLQEKNKQISYTREFLLVLERKTKRLEQSQIVAIRNADNELLAAAFLVWDKKSLYYLIPCYSEAHKDTGAGALLALEAIKTARQIGVAFDFEGSMIKGVANHYKQFGSTATQYYSVEKYYRWWFRLATAWNWFKQRKMQ